MDFKLSRLRSLAYNILGDYQEAKDIVQDSIELFLKTGKEIHSPEAYVSKTVINKAIDRWHELTKRKEAYTGTWLPEPIVSEDQSAETEDLLPYSMMVLLEKLNPYERAIFIMREAFDHSYAEIAEFTGLQMENCRQLFHRASEKIQSNKARFTAEEEQKKKLIKAFIQACEKKDPVLLEKILKDDIVLYSDGGGKIAAALKPVYGRENIIRFIFGILKINPNLTYRLTYVNNTIAAVAVDSSTDKIDTVGYATVEDGQINNFYFVRNPDKINI